MIESKNLWEEKFENIIGKEDSSVTQYFLQLVGVALGASELGDVISQLYKVLDLDNFLKVLKVLSGRTISFPPVAQFKDLLILSICYIYRERGYDWKDIKQILPFKEVNPYKVGIRLNSLKKKIHNSLWEILVYKNKDEKR
jgi:hypothetical protein